MGCVLLIYLKGVCLCHTVKGKEHFSEAFTNQQLDYLQDSAQRWKSHQGLLHATRGVPLSVFSPPIHPMQK